MRKPIAILKNSVKQFSIVEQTEAKLFEGLYSYVAKQPEFFASSLAESCSCFSNRLVRHGGLFLLNQGKRKINSFPGNQGSLTLCNANQWTPTGAYSVTKPETYTVTSNTTIGTTKIFAPNVATYRPVNNKFDIVSNTFEFAWATSTPTYFSCGTSSGGGSGGCIGCLMFAETGYDDYAEAVAKGEMEYPIWQDAARFYDRQHLIENILLDSTLLNNNSIDSFYSNTADEDFKRIIEYENYLKNENNEDAALKLAELEGNENITHAYKIVNDIYLQTYALEVDTFTAEQYDQLYDIAHSCPFVYGNSVFQARGMIALLDTTGYDDSLLCGSGYAYKISNIKLNKTSTKTNDFSFNLKPNPAKNNVSFIYANKDACSNFQLNIYNALGVLIKSIDLVNAEDKLEINISTWANGMYYCKITDGYKILGNKKLVVNND
jgi:hypothetical protein